MALVGRRDGRNFGYGRQLSYAGPQALKDLFGSGHFGTVKAHSDRWQAFVRWCRSADGPGVNDARQIDRQTNFPGTVIFLGSALFFLLNIHSQGIFEISSSAFLSRKYLSPFPSIVPPQRLQQE